jgi:hypothetical protein
MSLIAATQLTAVATLALAVFAIITAVVAALAFRKQSAELTDQRAVNTEQTKVLRLQADELRASLSARETASLELRQQWASTVVVWPELRQDTARDWLVRAHVLNTGNRPVRDVTAQWYAGGKAITEPENLKACLLPKELAHFGTRVSSGDLAENALGIVQFRTVGDDWWRAETDGGLEISDVPPVRP